MDSAWILGSMGAAGLLGGAAALGWGEARWRRATRRLLAELQADPPTPLPRVTDETLPRPVARYLRCVLPEAVVTPSAVELETAGDFNLSERGQAWHRFTAWQRARLDAPGFVWDGRIHLAPGLAVRVHDALVGGQGRLHASLAGLLTLADLRDRQTLAEGELLRYLAESPWYPQRLRPGGLLQWRALDDHRALLGLRGSPPQAWLTVVFGEDGLVCRVQAAARGRSLQGRMVPTPWEGRWSDYQRHGGLLLPTRGEVAWCPPGEPPRPYWRGRLLAMSAAA